MADSDATSEQNATTKTAAVLLPPLGESPRHDPTTGIRNYSQSLPSSALAQFSQRVRLRVNNKSVMAPPPSPPPSECLPRIRDYFSIRKSPSSAHQLSDQQQWRRQSADPSRIDELSDLDLLTRQELVDLITAAPLQMPENIRRIVDQRKQVPPACKHAEYHTSPFLLPRAPASAADDMDEFSLCSGQDSMIGSDSPPRAPCFSSPTTMMMGLRSEGNKQLVEWAKNLSIDKVIQRSSSPLSATTSTIVSSPLSQVQNFMDLITASPETPPELDKSWDCAAGEIELSQISPNQSDINNHLDNNYDGDGYSSSSSSSSNDRSSNDRSNSSSNNGRSSDSRSNNAEEATKSAQVPAVDPVGELNELLQAAATAITSAAVTTTAPTAAIRETTNIVPLPLPPSVPSATTTSAATVSNDNSNDIRDVLVAIELFLDELNGFPVAVRYLCPLFSKHTKANRCGLALQTRFNSNQVMADMEKSRPVWVLATAGYDEEEVNVYLKIECRRTGIRAFCSLLDIQRDIYSFSDRVDNGGKWTRLAEAQMQLYALRRARKWH